jgi:hypothetical protein
LRRAFHSATCQQEGRDGAQSNSQNVKVGIEQGGARMCVKNGGVLDLEPGGVLSQGGVPLKIARGQLTTVTAADTV